MNSNPQKTISQSLIQDYHAQGFVLVRGLVSDATIAPFLAAYQQEVVPSKQKLYRQNTHQYYIHKAPYSFKADMLTKFRALVYDSPHIMKLVRKLQNKSMADF